MGQREWVWREGGSVGLVAAKGIEVPPEGMQESFPCAFQGSLDRKKQQSADHKMSFLTASSNWLLLLLTITFTCLQQKASAQPGFLSLDCGAPAPYNDTRGISWVPDDAYISSGKTASVVVADPVSYSYLKELRYFPDTTRTRYCYSLPTTIGQNYLIRALFFHGGYDNNPVVKFNAAVDVFATNKTFSFNTQNGNAIGEYIFRAFKDNVQYCLFRTSPTDNPFISSLELRSLDNTMYTTVADGSALCLQGRVNFGALAVNPLPRYPYDPYDRFWFTVAAGNGLSSVSATSVVDTGYAVDKPPPEVMNTAVTVSGGGGAGAYIYWSITPTFHNNTFKINVFLAELQTAFEQSRTFNILMNDLVVVPNVNIYSSAFNMEFKPIEFFSDNSTTVNAKGQLNITLAQTGSPLGPPPLWNAAEIFSVHKQLPGTLASDVAAIEGLKKAFGLGTIWTGDPCLFLPYDWLTCSIDFPPRVTAVKLSNASLSGPIPDLRALTSLTTLDLDNNNLTGPVPDWLASLPNLTELHLQNNHLTGNVPKGLLGLPGLSVGGNPGLCSNSTCSTDSKTKSNVVIIVVAVIGVLVAVGILIAVIVVVCCCCRRSTANTGMKAETPPVSEIVMEEGTTGTGGRYTLAQVMTATKNNAKLLGKGGFGPVYYGKLASGQEVAVKVSAKGSNQGSKEFINEIELLTRVHHKSLVTLVGYCDEGDNLILLYEYMSKGTVQEHLYGVGEQKKDSYVDWKTRLEIALSAAQGLEYLHVGCHPVIFHRDVKSNNILLNDKLIAKVADFGLSKSAESKDNVTHMSTMVKGTIGYLDPEYYMTNQLTDKSDVYGFGIFLLELICARPPFVQQLPEDQRRLDQWVRPYLERGTIEEIVDPALAGQYNLDAIWKVADLAMQSVEPKGKHRPNMSTVVQELRGALAIEINESSSSIPSPGQDSSSAFRFDIPQSDSIIPDPQFGADPTIQAR